MTKVVRRVEGDEFELVGYYRSYPPALVNEHGRYVGPLLESYELLDESPMTEYKE